MYSEKKFKNYIFWLQVKKVFIIIVLSCLGSALGVLIGKILESAAQITSFNNLIIIISTIIFFLIALLLTTGTSRQVQDGYWKIAVLRKLTVIQKSLELNNELLKNSNKSKKSKDIPIIKESEVNDVEETEINEKVEIDKVEDGKVEDNKVKEDALVPKKISKMKKAKNKIKTLKKPEEIVNQ